ncbi:hypothetical protein T492DRAFT_1055360 [Pavlovales sp. CCMP2436]|nr:hypothetical protein T492DRAFT_1055360 [Pavlovales sp. CCMP2436]
MQLSRAMVVTVAGAGWGSVNGPYGLQSAAVVPKGFASVCVSQGWDTAQMWQKLNSGREWFGHDNGAYIYLNSADDNWWIDEPAGAGIYVAPAKGVLSPPRSGWRALRQDAGDLPTVSEADGDAPAAERS